MLFRFFRSRLVDAVDISVKIAQHFHPDSLFSNDMKQNMAKDEGIITTLSDNIASSEDEVQLIPREISRTNGQSMPQSSTPSNRSEQLAVQLESTFPADQDLKNSEKATHTLDIVGSDANAASEALEGLQELQVLQEHRFLVLLCQFL